MAAQTDQLKLSHPIVLIHGLGAKSTYGPFEYFHGIPGLLRSAGNQVYVANLTAWHTIEHRSQQLKTQIEKHFPEGKVNLIGHSMGGLDARYLTSALDFQDRVASVTTIGTPHRGSVMSDLAMGVVPEKAIAAVERVLGWMDSSSGGFKQVSTHYAEVLAASAPNMPGIGYFSATSAIPDPVMKYALPVFWIPHRILKKHEGDNDGFVSVTSAQWGEHICTYRGDHYGQIGQFLGLSRGLDHIAFFKEIIERLHKEGM